MQDPSRVIRRKIRLLQSEVQMLQHYHSQIVDLHEDYKQEYASDLDFFVSKARELFKEDEPEPEPESQEPTGTTVAMDDLKFRQQQEAGSGDDISDQKPSTKKSDAPEWARKLFKKIALMTHPDRIGDENLRENLQKSFMRANRALEDGKLDDLLGVAIDLNVDAGLEDEALIPLLSAKIQSCKDAIQQIESTPEWIWGESLGIHAQRSALLAVLLGKRGFNLTPDQVDKMVTERER